ncbi:hypothetical protein [Halomonas salinarum]|uniref:hypothetical protein n=1 Tax=Halomonas salinarum TaxID=1158993 RepID=UPI001ADE57C0|nr:hypothetical protein [Halomonas salinarum]
MVQAPPARKLCPGSPRARRIPQGVDAPPPPAVHRNAFTAFYDELEAIVTGTDSRESLEYVAGKRGDR